MNSLQSVIATPQSRYSEERASHMLAPFGDDVLSEATRVLLESTVLLRIGSSVNRRVPGRNFAFTERYVVCL